MSKLKVNEDLFIGNQELNRFVKFLSDDGYKLLFGSNIEKYGFIDRVNQDTNFDSLQLMQGSSSDKLTLKAGLAIDSNLDFIYNESITVDALTIPTDNLFRDVTIKYNTSNIEKGLIDVASDGTITGVGTLFSEVLRGQPNFPSKIRFPNSAINTGEYLLVSISNDTEALLTGALSVETDLEYVVIGTFTPDVITPIGSKDIFVYDSFTLTLGGAAVDGVEFLLGKVKSDGVSLEIQDVRTEKLQTVSGYSLTNITTTVNTSIGVESIKYNTLNSDGASNIIKIGWGFRSETAQWSYDLNSNEIIISAGLGGVHKTTSTVVDSEFDGWRVYFNDDYYLNVLTSTSAAGTVRLQVRSIDITRIDISDGISIVPNADSIEISNTSSHNPNIESTYVFPIQNGVATYQQKVGTVSVYYRNILGKLKTELSLINDGSYYGEDNFDDDGVQTSFVDTAYTSGIIILLLSPNNLLDKITGVGNTGFALLNGDNTFNEVNTFKGRVEDSLEQVFLSTIDYGNFPECIDVGTGVLSYYEATLQALILDNTANSFQLQSAVNGNTAERIIFKDKMLQVDDVTNTNPIIVTTATPHNLVDSERVSIFDVLGTGSPMAAKIGRAHV